MAINHLNAVIIILDRCFTFFFYNCRCDRALYPPDLKDFIQKYEAVSTSGNNSKGEGLDAQLEEVNKSSKCWENGAMTAREWLTIFRNHDELVKVTVVII